jgi:hypothetical protein
VQPFAARPSPQRDKRNTIPEADILWCSWLISPQSGALPSGDIARSAARGGARAANGRPPQATTNTPGRISRITAGRRHRSLIAVLRRQSCPFSAVFRLSRPLTRQQIPATAFGIGHSVWSVSRTRFRLPSGHSEPRDLSRSHPESFATFVRMDSPSRVVRRVLIASINAEELIPAIRERRLNATDPMDQPTAPPSCISIEVSKTTRRGLSCGNAPDSLFYSTFQLIRPSVGRGFMGGVTLIFKCAIARYGTMRDECSPPGQF